MEKRRIKYSLAFLGMSATLALTGCSLKKENEIKMEQVSVTGLEEALSDTNFLLKNKIKDQVKEMERQISTQEAYREAFGEVLDTIEVDIMKDQEKGTYLIQFFTENEKEYYCLLTEDTIQQLGMLIGWLDYSKCKGIGIENCDDPEVFDILSKKEKITQIYCSNCDLDNLDRLEEFPNLKELRIENCKNIENLEWVKNLSNLEKLTVIGTNVSDCKPLAGLTNLTLVDLRFNNISDIMDLYQLPNIERVLLYGNKIEEEKDLDPLVEKGVMTDYTRSLTWATNRPVNTMVNELVISVESERDEEEYQSITIAKLDNKEQYLVTVKNEDHTSQFALLDHLERNNYLYNYSYQTIVLKNCSSLEVLKQFKNPEAVKSILCISSNNESLDGIERYTNLEKLYCMNCPNLTDIDALSKATNLTSLTISNSGLVDVTAIKNLLNLEKASLVNDEIESIDEIVDLPKISFLDLGGNYIIDTTSLIALEERGVDTAESSRRQFKTPKKNKEKTYGE